MTQQENPLKRGITKRKTLVVLDIKQQYEHKLEQDYAALGKRNWRSKR